MGLHTLDTYDPAICQAFCDAADLCTGFNLYFERDPTVNPADNCRNPPSFTNIKCTLWGSRLTPETAVNRGQYRRDFQVVITGSNGMILILGTAGSNDTDPNFRLHQKEPTWSSTWV